MTLSVADNSKFQYNQCMTKEVVINQEKFLIKRNSTTINVDYLDLWKVVKLIFIAMQGQNFIE